MLMCTNMYTNNYVPTYIGILHVFKFEIIYIFIIILINFSVKVYIYSINKEIHHFS